MTSMIYCVLPRTKKQLASKLSAGKSVLLSFVLTFDWSSQLVSDEPTSAMDTSTANAFGRSSGI